MDRATHFVNANVLVVGGTGFLGFHIASYLLKHGANVYSISKTLPPTSRYLSGLVYWTHDLLEPFSFTHPIRSLEFHYIFNCSGYVDHSPFFDGGSSVVRTSINSTLNLVESFSWHSVISFIQLGSSDEYGSLPPPQSESSKPEPLTAYALSKSSITNLLLYLAATESLPVTVVRPFLVYGPHQDCNRLLPYVIQNCLSDFSFSLTSGSQLRDFLYVDDFVDALTTLAVSPNVAGHIFNVGSGLPISVRDVVLHIQSIIGLGSPVFGSKPLRSTENSALYADISHIMQIIQWKPKTPLLDGLNRTIIYYRSLSE